MANYLFDQLETILLPIQDAFNSPREQMPTWMATFMTPTFMAVAILTTVPPPGPTRVIVGLTAFTSLWLYMLTHWVTGPAFFLEPIFMLSITARWLLMFLTGTPETDYYQTKKNGTRLESRNGAPWTQRIFIKVKWSIELWSCWRGQSWNYVDQHLHQGAEQTQSRREFLTVNAGRILLNQQIVSLVRKHAFCAFWPVLTDHNTPVDFKSLPLWNRHVLVFFQLFCDHLMLDTKYRQMSLLFVGLFLSTPDGWPDLFSKPADLYTVRNFWGRCWHQIFRQVFVRSGELVASALGAKKGTLVHKYSKLYVGFLVSGVQHYACPLFIPSVRYGWGMFWQMPGYAAVVTVEDLLKHYGKKAGIRDSTFVRFLGYIWTAYWMTLIYALPVGYVSDIGGLAGVCLM